MDYNLSRQYYPQAEKNHIKIKIGIPLIIREQIKKRYGKYRVADMKVCHLQFNFQKIVME